MEKSQPRSPEGAGLKERESDNQVRAKRNSHWDFILVLISGLCRLRTREIWQNGHEKWALWDLEPARSCELFCTKIKKKN